MDHISTLNDSSHLWFWFGRLPILTSLVCFAFVSVRRLGARISLWAGAVFLASFSLGVTFLPSILGAICMSALSYFIVLRVLAAGVQEGIWRVMVWPLAVMFAVVLGVGRIGCWLSGCCFGEVTTRWWSTQYSGEDFIAHYHLDRYGELMNGLPYAVHPTQLYESALVLLCLGVAIWTRRRVNEVSAALILGGGYLIIRALVDPLRATVNTIESLTQWGVLSLFQWVCLGGALCLTRLAWRCRDVTIPRLLPELRARSLSSDHPLALIGGWSVVAAMTFCSVELGTLLTAQLSALALGIAVTPLVKYARRIWSELREDLTEVDADPSMPLGSWLGSAFTLYIAVALTPLLVLTPLNKVLSAQGEGAQEDRPQISRRGWVYGIDPLTHKLGRVGRVDQFPLLTLRPRHVSAMVSEGLTDDDKPTRIIRSLASPETQPISKTLKLASSFHSGQPGDMTSDSHSKETTAPHLRILSRGNEEAIKSDRLACSGDIYYLLHTR